MYFIEASIKHTPLCAINFDVGTVLAYFAIFLTPCTKSFKVNRLTSEDLHIKIKAMLAFASSAFTIIPYTITNINLFVNRKKNDSPKKFLERVMHIMQTIVTMPEMPPNESTVYGMSDKGTDLTISSVNDRFPIVFSSLNNMKSIINNVIKSRG